MEYNFFRKYHLKVKTSSVFANSSSLRVLWLNKSLVKFSFKIKASEWNSCWIVELSRLLHAQFLEFCPIQEASRPLPLLKQVNANTWNWKCLRCCVSTVWKRCLLTNWWATWINWGVSNQETLHGRLQVVTTLSAWSGVWWSTCCKFSCVSHSISFQWLLVMVLVEWEWRCREEHFEITGIDPLCLLLNMEWCLYSEHMVKSHCDMCLFGFCSLKVPKGVSCTKCLPSNDSTFCFLTFTCSSTPV